MVGTSELCEALCEQWWHIMRTMYQCPERSYRDVPSSLDCVCGPTRPGVHVGYMGRMDHGLDHMVSAHQAEADTAVRLHGPYPPRLCHPRVSEQPAEHLELQLRLGGGVSPVLESWPDRGEGASIDLPVATPAHTCACMHIRAHGSCTASHHHAAFNSRPWHDYETHGHGMTMRHTAMA